MNIHWHFDNPWRRKAIDVPLEDVLPLTAKAYLRDYGPKLDAYILVQPDGRHEVGVRYGKEPHQYVSPSIQMCAFLPTLVEKHQLQWRPCRWDDEDTRPTIDGVYFFRIAGDCETDGPHVYYDYPDYTTSGRVFTAEGETHAYGDTDEEPEHIIAWYGPLTAPPCDI